MGTEVQGGGDRLLTNGRVGPFVWRVFGDEPAPGERVIGWDVFHGNQAMATGIARRKDEMGRVISEDAQTKQAKRCASSVARILTFTEGA